MDKSRWKKIEDIFQEALDYPFAEREKFIREKSGGDEELRLEVEKLVARYETEDDFLESPVWTDSLLLQSKLKNEIASSLEEINPLPDEKSFIGRQIGVYRLTKELGRGGMGVVFHATRTDGEFQQEVAIKLIKRGMDTDFILRRFRRERQIAAALNHPNIARLLDGGTTEDDLPYFVMEFVEGSSFFKYAQTHNLNLREKLELFLQVCRAIAYAHRKRIIHRDIKPSNILVTEEGEPKLLDFGIAKILDPDLIHESAIPTATQMRLMTPEYASPEQARGDEIDEASDQYSLGVLLYELLTGQRPYKFPSRAPHEIARIICEEIPSEPSSGEFGQNFFESAEISSFDQDFCQKLDRIVLKSLRKNPVERYASVKDLTRDIERFLRNEPVLAESFTGENSFGKAHFRIVAPVVTNQKSIAVLPFKILDTLSEVRDNDGEFLGIGLADSLITRLSNIKQFLVRPTSSILSYAAETTDSVKAGAELNVQYILDGSIIRTNTRIRVSVQLLNIAEQTTVWAGRFDENPSDFLNLEDLISARVAESLVPQLSTGEAQNLAKRGTDNASAYEAYLRGRFYWNTFTEEGFRQAIAFYNKAIELDPDYALAFAAIADYYLWLGVYGAVPSKECYANAQQAAQQAIALDDKLAEAYGALGLAKLYGGYDWQQSETDIIRAIELNPNNSVVHLWYSHNLYTQGRFEEGIVHVTRAVELDPLSFLNHNTLAWSYYFSRLFDKALEKIYDVIERFPAISHSYFSKACFLNRVGRADEALKEINRALELSDESLFTNYGLAQTLGALGKRREAVELIEKIEAKSETKYFSYYQVALVYCYLKDNDKAFEYLELAFENRETLLVWIGIEPSLDPIRSDPRFISFLNKIDHPALKTIYKDALEQKTLLKDSERSGSSQKSIAILPFKSLNTLSGEDTGDGGYLTIGLADALITRLSNVRQFIVRPTSSVMRFNGADVDSFAAGRELSVDFILDGNILRTEKRIRVSVQLLDVAEGSTIWAERFDEDLLDVLTLEDFISKRVVESLVPQLSSGEQKQLAKRGTDNASAYEAYLRGRFYWNTFTEESFAKAFVAYHEAISHDPNYALAYAGIADYYIWLGIYGVFAPKDCYPPAKTAAARAIELDGDLADAYASLGLASLCGDYDWRTSEQNMLRAIELNPNHSVAHLWYSYLLQSAGRFDEGIAQALRAVELDPLTYTNYHVLVWAYYFARRFDKAAKQAAANVRKFPEISLAHFTQSWVLRFSGRYEDALTASQKSLDLSGSSLFMLLGHAQALAAADKKADTEEVLQRIFKQGEKQYLSHYQIALVYVYAEEKEKALDALEKADEQHEGWLIWLRSEPALDFLRDEPRFQTLLEKTGHPLAKTKVAAPVYQKKRAVAAENQLTKSEAQTLIQKPSEPQKKSRSAFLKFSIAAGFLAFIVFFFFFVYPNLTLEFSSLAPSERWGSNFASTMNINRLTDSGQAQIAAISPDGTQIAFALKEDDRQGLWIRDTGSGNARQLVAPEPVLFAGINFSPDGQSIYYTAWGQNFISRNLYRVSIAGNNLPQLVLEQVNSGIGFSPDGKQIAYVSYDQKSRKFFLYLAELGESGKASSPRILAEYAAPGFIRCNPSFSPDGGKIGYIVGDTSGKKDAMNLYAFDLATNTASKISEHSFGDVSAIAWRGNGGEIVLSAAEHDGLPYQLWVVEYPSGKAVRLTNDFSSYFDVSIAPDSKALVTAKREKSSAVWVADLNAPDTAEQITTGAERLDGLNGVSWTANDQLLYIGGIGSNYSIMMMNADGSNNRQLDINVVRPVFPSLTKDKRHVVFADSKEHGSSIWRYDTESGRLENLTPNYAVSPTLSPDGRFVVYTTNNASRKLALHKIPIEGGTQTEITSNLSASAVVSPDGKLIACYYSGEETGSSWRLAILSAENGKVVRVIAPPNTFNIQIPLERPLAWSPDSRSVYYVNDKNNVSNIFRVEIEEDKPPVQITRFPSGRIFDFSLSPDGNRVALARGTSTSDIVIFKSSR